MRLIGLAVVLCISVLTAPLAAEAQQAAQERIISKPDAEMIFAFTRVEWERYARQVAPPEGWTLRLLPLDTGTGPILGWHPSFPQYGHDVAQTRAAMRALGIGKIVVTPTETGWSFAGDGNLAGMVGGALGVPRRSPR